MAPCYDHTAGGLGSSSTPTILKENKLQGTQAELKLAIQKQIFKFENIDIFITMTKVLYSSSKV